MEHSRVKLKDHFRETQLFSNRIIVAGSIILLMLSVIVARMIYLQIVSHEHYTTLSQVNRVSIVPVGPTRGLIYDRNGNVLAENIPSFTLELIPEKIDDLEATIEKLKLIVDLSEDDIERFYKARKRNSAFKSIPLSFRLNEEEVARFSVRQHQFPGVELNARLTRHYPYNEAAVHVLGYVSRINEAELRKLDAADYSATSHIGKLGIEKEYEDYLHGTVGFRKVETNAQGRILRVLEEQLPVPGQDIYLTIDMDVQIAAEKALAGWRGALVALNPKNGDVIAMASVPMFDPNLFVNGIDSKSYKALSTSLERPLFNRAIKGRYPPGSTLKPFIGLAGLEYDVVNQGTSIGCKGWYQLKNDKHRFRDWKKFGHGSMDLFSAIRESCDVYFYDMSLNLGIDRIFEYNSYFGFGKYTGIDIPGETSGLLPSRAWKRRVKNEAWYPGETLITGIGQGFNVTSPVQLAVGTAILAGHGLHIIPHIGLALKSNETGELDYFEPQVVGVVPIKKPANWDYMIKSMEAVVHSTRGSARSIGKDASYRIAGKTGTAQVFGIAQDAEYDAENVAERLRDHALFIAFAPSEDPKIAVAVIVENGESGGRVAAPIVRKVLDAYLLKNAKEPIQ